MCIILFSFHRMKKHWCLRIKNKIGHQQKQLRVLMIHHHHQDIRSRRRNQDRHPHLHLLVDRDPQHNAEHHLQLSVQGLQQLHPLPHPGMQEHHVQYLNQDRVKSHRQHRLNDRLYRHRWGDCSGHHL